MTEPRNPFEGGTSDPVVLSDEDRAELTALREERGRRAAEAEAAKAAEPEPYLYLHLADGRVIPSTGQMTHYKGVQVVGAYPITKEEVTE